MWSLIKWLFIIAIIGGAVLWYTGYKIEGKTIQEHLKPVLEKKTVKEGIHDLRSIVGEGLKAAGEAVSEDVTDSERKQLDNVVRQELDKGKPIAGVPGQMALPAMPQAPVAGGTALQQVAPQPAPTEKQQAKDQTLIQAVQQIKQQAVPPAPQPALVQTAPAQPQPAPAQPVQQMPTPTP
ncbi:MAG: hypothetical protein V2A66_03920 [Pseudomonadota bacterium]